MGPGFKGFQGSEEKANLREKGSIKDVCVNWLRGANEAADRC